MVGIIHLDENYLGMRDVPSQIYGSDKVPVEFRMLCQELEEYLHNHPDSNERRIAILYFSHERLRFYSTGWQGLPKIFQDTGIGERVNV